MTSDLVYIESKLQLSRCLAIGRGMKKTWPIHAIQLYQCTLLSIQEFLFNGILFLWSIYQALWSKTFELHITYVIKTWTTLGRHGNLLFKVKIFWECHKNLKQATPHFLTLLTYSSSIKKRLFQIFLTFSECLNFLCGDLSEHDLGQKRHKMRNKN